MIWKRREGWSRIFLPQRGCGTLDLTKLAFGFDRYGFRRLVRRGFRRLGGRDFPLDKRGGFYYTETNEKKQAGKKRSTFPNAVRRELSAG